MELRIGIDGSINSTGLVLMVKDDKQNIVETKYFLIVPWSKKIPACPSTAELIIYQRFWETKASTNSQSDLYKIISAEQLALEINKVINDFINNGNYEAFTEISCRIEGAIMASSKFTPQGRLNDLLLSQTIFKYLIMRDGLVTEFKIIPPKSLKKLATGNGNCKKITMTTTHQEKFADHNFDYETGKIDDLMDAFWLAETNEPANKIKSGEFFKCERIVEKFSTADREEKYAK